MSLERLRAVLAQCTQSLKEKHLRELQRLQRPPTTVRSIVEATAILLGAQEAHSWEAARRCLQGDVLERLQNASLDERTPKQSRRLRQLLALPDFDEAQVRASYPVAWPLASWCRTMGAILDGLQSEGVLQEASNLADAGAPGAPTMPRGQVVDPASEELSATSSLAYPDDAEARPEEERAGARPRGGRHSMTTENGLIVEPDLTRLAPAELRQVRDFVVSRPHVGSIHFHGLTDCTGLNIQKLVHLQIGSLGTPEILVYPNQDMKPPKGEGLNKGAVVTLCQCWPPNGRSHLKDAADKERYRGKIKQMTTEKKAVFIDYDCDTGIWTFEVDGF